MLKYLRATTQYVLFFLLISSIPASLLIFIHIASCPSCAGFFPCDTFLSSSCIYSSIANISAVVFFRTFCGCWHLHYDREAVLLRFRRPLSTGGSWESVKAPVNAQLGSFEWEMKLVVVLDCFDNRTLLKVHAQISSSFSAIQPRVWTYQAFSGSLHSLMKSAQWHTP